MISVLLTIADPPNAKLKERDLFLWNIGPIWRARRLEKVLFTSDWRGLRRPVALESARTLGQQRKVPSTSLLVEQHVGSRCMLRCRIDTAVVEVQPAFSVAVPRSCCVVSRRQAAAMVNDAAQPVFQAVLAGTALAQDIISVAFHVEIQRHINGCLVLRHFACTWTHLKPLQLDDQHRRQLRDLVLLSRGARTVTVLAVNSFLNVVGLCERCKTILKGTTMVSSVMRIARGNIAIIGCHYGAV